jgi:hypothetical protein
MDSEALAQLIGLLDRLAPDADASAVAALLGEDPEGWAAEVGAVPGHDQARAALIRALPLLRDTADADTLLAAADAALEAWDPAGLDGAAQIRRHPAWVGLATVELGAARGAPGADLGLALDRAARGFRAQGALHVGPGEVAWALAEAALEVGWHDRAGPLLDRAAEGPFADEENEGRVVLLRLLLALEGETDGLDPAIEPALEALLALGSADERTRVHALWIGAQRDREAGRLGRALSRLDEAAALLSHGEEPEVLARVEALRALLGGREGAEA